LGSKNIKEGAEKAPAQKMDLPRSDSRSFAGVHFFPQLPVQEPQLTLCLSALEKNAVSQIFN